MSQMDQEIGIPKIIQLIHQYISPRFHSLSVTVMILTLCLLFIMESFDRRTEIEEHGFCSGGSESRFELGWNSLAHNITIALRNDYEIFGKERQYDYDVICREARYEYRLIERGRYRRPYSSNDMCIPTTVEEHFYIGQYINQSSYNFLNKLYDLAQDPYFANIPKEWLRTSKGSGPSLIPYQSMKQSDMNNIEHYQYQLHDITTFSKENYSSLNQTLLNKFSLINSINLLSILVPSSRGDARDCFVLLFLFNWDSPSEFFVPGVALSVAKYLQTVPWNSRDVFVLLGDTKESMYGLGSRTFLNHYLRSVPRTIPYRGLIRLALIIEVGITSTRDTLLIDYEGPDGLQANQDIINVLINESQKIGVSVGIRPLWESIQRMAHNYGIHRSHTPFLEESIPAFTVIWNQKSLESKNTRKQIGQIIELITRSQSNILQSLHHSFNFYFFTSISRHISSGIYFFILVPMISLPALSILCSKEWNHVIDLFKAFLQFTIFPICIGGPLYILFTQLLGVYTVLTPLCAVTEVRRLPIYRLNVSIWIISLSIGFMTAILLNLGFNRFYQRSSKLDPQRIHHDHVPQWCYFRSILRLVGTVSLLLIMMMNWAICIPLTFWLVPALCIVRPLSFNYFVQAITYDTIETRIKKVITGLLIVSWIIGTVLVVSPLRIMQTTQKTVIIGFELLLKQCINYLSMIKFLKVVVQYIFPKGQLMSSHLYKYLVYSSSLFHGLKDSSLGHPLNTWPVMSTLSQIEFITNPFQNVLYRVSNSLSSNFVILCYEIIKNAYCISSVFQLIICCYCVIMYVAFITLTCLMHHDRL